MGSAHAGELVRSIIRLRDAPAAVMKPGKITTRLIDNVTDLVQYPKREMYSANSIQSTLR